ncbi:MAG: guanylate kinase [Actinobacteria bacterium]|nr:guanylate kinase [Actinomycetota bacterium]
MGSRPGSARSYSICFPADPAGRGTAIARVIVISGPSGSGKGTLIERLIASVPGLALSVSATTRPRRGGEEDGREYFFLSENEFRDWIAQDRFLEWAEYNGHLYGTPRAAVDRQLAAGLDVLLEIELEGAWQVHERRPEALMIFIEPPSFEELERRLRGRGTDSGEACDERLAKGREEMAAVEAEMAPGGRRRFHYVIVNDSVKRAADELACIILQAREEYEQADDR